VHQSQLVVLWVVQLEQVSHGWVCIGVSSQGQQMQRPVQGWPSWQGSLRAAGRLGGVNGSGEAVRWGM
jgi:hypothetical protein